MSSKLGMSEKEIGRITHLQYVKRRKNYENNFDLELVLTLARKTYAEFRRENEEESLVNDSIFINRYL